MSRPSVIALRQFYSSILGRRARTKLTAAMLKFWPELKGDVLVALGYATPLLRPYSKDDERSKECLLIPLMPSQQSAMYWPSHRFNRTALVHEDQYPLPNASINRIVMMHMLEHSAYDHSVLEECWRVLTPGGRMMVVVPNRLSIWSRHKHSPFAHGKPYTFPQLKELVCGDLFTHVETCTTIHYWPTERRSLLKIMDVIEPLFSLLFPMFGGVIMMEVEKQIYASTRQPAHYTKSPVYSAVTSKPAMTKLF